MIVLGSAYHAPDALAVRLSKKLNILAKQIAFVSSGCALPSPSVFKCFLFLDCASLRQQLHLVNSNKYRGTYGVVCDNIFALNNIQNLTPLDFKRSDNIHLDGFNTTTELDDVALASHDAPVMFEPVSFEDQVVEKVQSFQGILTVFMTFIYTTPSSTHQTPLKELACRWLSSTQDVNMLETSFAQLVCKIKLNEQKQNRFLSLLTSDTAMLYKEVINQVKALHVDSKEFNDAVKERGVSAYEVRYILAVAKNSDGTREK